MFFCVCVEECHQEPWNIKETYFLCFIYISAKTKPSSFISIQRVAEENISSYLILLKTYIGNVNYFCLNFACQYKNINHWRGHIRLFAIFSWKCWQRAITTSLFTSQTATDICYIMRWNCWGMCWEMCPWSYFLNVLSFKIQCCAV